MSRYDSAHLTSNLKGPSDARPTAIQIVKDEGLEGKLSGKVILITGCSSGLGIETARALHETGATVFVTGRDEARTREVIGEILKANGGEAKGEIHFVKMELDSLDSVREGAKEFLRMSGGKLNVLINNAGVG
jgi:NAD(P)-dependent dehydrogenase (short-subunit alcohol dehydrogenase family)